MMSDPDPLIDPHAAALYYAALGWRVLPIRPGTKYPAGIGRWQDAATTNPQIITNWWTQLYTGHGVGVATGPDSGIWVLDVDVADGKTGDDTLNDLEDTYGPLPDTVEAITGRGGRHLFFRYPTGMKVSAGAATRLGHGLDVRGWGGQVLVAPTVGPTGGAYTWVIGHEPGHHPIADAPGWLLALIEEPAASDVTSPGTSSSGMSHGDGDSIAAAFNAATTWPELLERDGWTLHHVNSDGEQHWTRPGKDRREGTSATVGYRGNDALKVFTSSVPGLEAERAYSRFGYEAAMRHRGDRSALASHLRRAQQAAGPDPLQWARDAMAATGDDQADGGGADHGWDLSDMAAITSGNYQPPVPTILTRNDGAGLFYTGRLNALWGESGSGKSWIALHTCAQLLADGETVLYLDWEATAAELAARLTSLDVAPQAINEAFLHIAPEQRWSTGAATHLAAIIDEHHPTVAVIDSTGEAMASDGVNPDKDDETARWHRELPAFLTRRGVTVVLVDHIPKNNDGRAPLHAIGSQRKRAAISGAAYMVEAAVSPAKGQEGHLKLICAKDRHGTYARGALVADVDLVSNAAGDHVQIRVRRHENVDRPTVLMERISRYLEENGPTSRRQVEKDVPGKGAGLRKAVEVLVLEEWVEMAPKPGRGGGMVLTVTKPYRDDETTSWIDQDDPESANRVPRVPSASPDEGRASEVSPGESASPASPHPIQGVRGGTRFDDFGDQPPSPHDTNRVPTTEPSWLI